MLTLRAGSNQANRSIEAASVWDHDRSCGVYDSWSSLVLVYVFVLSDRFLAHVGNWGNFLGERFFRSYRAHPGELASVPKKGCKQADKRSRLVRLPSSTC